MLHTRQRRRHARLRFELIAEKVDTEQDEELNAGAEELRKDVPEQDRGALVPVGVRVPVDAQVPVEVLVRESHGVIVFYDGWPVGWPVTPRPGDTS